MKGEDRYLSNLLEGAKTRFIIPVYQRNYDWKIEHCKRLFEDLEEMAKTHKDSHFFGSIVCSASSEERVIIDGQQRITTTFLLLLALVHQIEKGTITAKEKNLDEQINERYLIDKWHKDEHKLKLKLVKDDHAALIKIFEKNSEEYIVDSNVTQNYRYFCRRIADMTVTPDELFSAVEHLLIIDIKLDRDDDAQLIFESLNSTGLDLSEGDKIRNFILMDLKPSKQEEYYEKYWNRIEKNTAYDVSSFIRDYLAAKRRETPAIKRVYLVFKEYINNSDSSVEELLAELLKYSDYLFKIAHATTSFVKANAVLKRLNLLEMSVVNPYLLCLFDYCSNGFLDDEQLSQALISIETFLFRRWVCSVPTNALNKVFETLHNDIIKNMNDSDKYIDVLNYVLLHKEGLSGRFPDDEEFLSALATRDFYRIQSKRFYLYDRLENGDSKERVRIVDGLQDETYSVEHIMPQTLSPTWKSELGDNWEHTHMTWVNRMANLTITGYNSTYSNRSFIEKRDIKNGFKESGLRINKWIGEQNRWSENELEERKERLDRQFIDLWPLPKTSFAPKETINEVHSLEEEFDFTNRKIAAYTFMGSRYTVKTWVDMTVGVFKLLADLDPTILHKLVGEDAYPASNFLAEEKNGFDEIVDGVFVFTASSTESKLDLIERILARYSLETSELTFEIYQSEGVQRRALSETKQIQLSYWLAYSELAKQDSSFSELFTPQKAAPQHWTSLAVGSSSYHIDLAVDTQKMKVMVDFNISSDKKLYREVRGKLEEFAQGNGFQYTTWGEGTKSSGIRLFREQCDIKANLGEWDDFIGWQLKTAVLLRKELGSLGL